MKIKTFFWYAYVYVNLVKMGSKLSIYPRTAQ